MRRKSIRKRRRARQLAPQQRLKQNQARKQALQHSSPTYQRRRSAYRRNGTMQQRWSEYFTIAGAETTLTKLSEPVRTNRAGLCLANAQDGRCWTAGTGRWKNAKSWFNTKTETTTTTLLGALDLGGNDMDSCKNNAAGLQTRRKIKACSSGRKIFALEPADTYGMG